MFDNKTSLWQNRSVGNPILETYFLRLFFSRYFFDPLTQSKFQKKIPLWNKIPSKEYFWISCDITRCFFPFVSIASQRPGDTEARGFWANQKVLVSSLFEKWHFIELFSKVPLPHRAWFLLRVMSRTLCLVSHLSKRCCSNICHFQLLCCQCLIQWTFGYAVLLSFSINHLYFCTFISFVRFI